MESLKLKITSANRQRLFYSKYLYKADIRILGAKLLSKSTRSFDQFKKTLTRLKQDTWRQWTVRHIKLKDVDEPTITNLIDFIQKYKLKTDKCTFRFEDSMSFYTNSVDIMTELAEIYPQVVFQQAVIPPQGIMYFTNEPKHKYRIYCKDTRVPVEQFNQFRKTVLESADLTPSPKLEAGFGRDYNMKHRWLDRSHFIDYDNESTITYMYLKFGDILGRRYNLEKRPVQP